MCGVSGVICKDTQSASGQTFRALLNLQHRGQDSAGIVSYDFQSQRFYQKREAGLISDVFKANDFPLLPGSMAIAHNRYSTQGDQTKENIQPVIAPHPFGLAMAHNGNISNYLEIKDYLRKTYRTQLLGTNDLEAILYLWAIELRNQTKEGMDPHFEGMVAASRATFSRLDGGYSVVGMLADGGLFAFRDPLGIRPLHMARSSDSVVLASETTSFRFFELEDALTLKPGELVFVDSDLKISRAVVSEKNLKKRRPRPCMFEWVYFAAAEGEIENRSVYGTRLELGRCLGEKIKNECENLVEENGGELLSTIHERFGEVVMPIPDTGRTAAISIAEVLGLPYREGLIKNRYIFRSFILKNQTDRDKALELKLSPVASEIEGKSLIVVDDSIVRGTTSTRLVALLKKYGAKKVTLVITCPPLMYGCFYGVDFPDPTTLVAAAAAGKGMKEIEDYVAREVGADRVLFLEKKDLFRATQKESLCTACLDGDYPTLYPRKREQAQAFINWREEVR